MSYSKDICDFIAANVKGRTTAELVELTNNTLGTQFTESKMKSFKANHKLKSGTSTGGRAGRPTKLYPQPVRDYILANHKGIGPKEMTHRVNAHFGAEYTHKQLRSYYKNNQLNSGVTGRFQKGQVSPNKGRFGYAAPGCEKGWIKKGSAPHNQLPVGSKVFRTDGYLWRKISDPDIWKQEHVLVYEEANGPIPNGHIITFLDGDRTNVAPENLAIITRQENLALTRLKLRTSSAEHTEAGILVAKVAIAGWGAQKRRRERRDELK